MVINEIREDLSKALSKQNERIKLLERELQIRNRNMTTQTEKLNMYRNEFASVKARLNMKMRENDNLVKKMADISIKNKELMERERPFKEQIYLLESLNKSYSQQISELESTKDMLLRQGR